MTAALSPAELDEVTRFGIHTPDIIRDMDEHFGDVVECDHCARPAALRLLRLCCPSGGPVCDTHHQAIVGEIERNLDARGTECLRCHAKFYRPKTVKDIIAEVAL